MIIGWILSLLGSTVSWLLGLIPAFPVPAWLTTAGSYLGTVVNAMGQISAWLPWTLLVTGVGVVIAAVVAGIVIRGVRIAASFLTLGGGS